MNAESLKEIIKQDLPALLREDPALRAYILDLTRQQYADRPPLPTPSNWPVSAASPCQASPDAFQRGVTSRPRLRRSELAREGNGRRQAGVIREQARSYRRLERVIERPTGYALFKVDVSLAFCKKCAKLYLSRSDRATIPEMTRQPSERMALVC